MEKKRVLFVCTGNTCRSPMAEALARKLLQEQEGQALEIAFASAGLAAFSGDTASQHATDVMAEQGIELREHRANFLTRELLEEANLVLTMTKGHHQQILAKFPEFKEKVFPIKEFVTGEQGDIADPYGRSKEVYAKCAEELKHLLREVLTRV